MLDPEKIVSLKLIRQHTRTDDVTAVSDELLSQYRKAALEAAEAYTGMGFLNQRTIDELIEQPPFDPGNVMWRHQLPYFHHRARFTFAAPLAYLYGTGKTETIPVEVGGNTAKLPKNMTILQFGDSRCEARQRQVRFQYKAGFVCESGIPATVAIGVMKYIAHQLENAGDVYVPAGGINASAGSANPAVASGAIELWRQAVPAAI
jgi:hypothetical protein